MEKIPLISVIVPAYNAEKWIEECCSSVITQSYDNVELIIIDDGSVDGTLSIARQIASHNDSVKVIHTENAGVSHARNSGLELAEGEYIMFLDADDVLTINAIETLYSKLISSQADIAIGWQYDISADGKNMGLPYKVEKGEYTGTEGLCLSLKDHPAMHAVWGKLFNRNLIGDIRFAEGRKVHEDGFFVFECLCKEPKVVLCEDVVLKYRRTKNSASRSDFSEKFFDIIYFAEQKRILLMKKKPMLSSLVENAIIKAHMALLKNLLKTTKLEYREIEKRSIYEVLSKRNYYIQGSKFDDKLFWVITHRLYGAYKLMHRLKSMIYKFCCKVFAKVFEKLKL